MLEALTTVKADLLFWQREVYERLGKEPVVTNQNTSTSQNTWQPNYHKPKGKGKFTKGFQKGKSKGKGKGAKGKYGGKSKPGKGQDAAPAGWPKGWALRNPKGVEFCHSFLLRNACNGNCGRSHNCPQMSKGWVCNQPPDSHTAGSCASA
jgi:hypothetical protein